MNCSHAYDNFHAIKTLCSTAPKKSPLTHLIDPGAGTRALLRYVGPKCLLEVTNSSSHNLPNHMISSFANQTHHNQPPLYQKHMGTCCFNTHLNVFFLLTSAPLQFENRLLNTTMALSSKTKCATRMCILRRYHLPAVAICAMKILISGSDE